MRAAGLFANAMVISWVRHLVKVLTVVDEALDEPGSVLEEHVVVHDSVDQEEVILESRSVSDR